MFCGISEFARVVHRRPCYSPLFTPNTTALLAFDPFLACYSCSVHVYLPLLFPLPLPIYDRFERSAITGVNIKSFQCVDCLRLACGASGVPSLDAASYLPVVLRCLVFLHCLGPRSLFCVSRTRSHPSFALPLRSCAHKRPTKSTKDMDAGSRTHLASHVESRYISHWTLASETRDPSHMSLMGHDYSIKARSSTHSTP